jgi:hypothetical protein
MSRNQYTISSLEVNAQQEIPLSNKFIKHKTPSDRLALLFPGLRYTCDMPLLYYSTGLLLERGCDVLQLWKDSAAPEFEHISQAVLTQQLLEYSEALLAAGKNSGTYNDLLLVGKSLGTMIMTLILSNDQALLNKTTIWLTPLVNLPPVSQVILSLSGPAFIAGGDADPTFGQEAVSQILAMPNTTTTVLKDADHRLEIPGDPIRSLQNLSQVMIDLAGFIY